MTPKHQTTEDELRAILEKEPEDTAALLDLGVILGRSNRQEEAIKVLEQLLKLDPENQTGIFELGYCFVTTDQFDKAEIQYQKLLDLKPGNANAWFNLGLARKKKGDLKGAEQAFSEVTKIDPYDHFAFVNLGSIYEKLHNYPKAVEHYLKSLEIDPTNLLVYSNLGVIYEKQEKLSEAKELYWKAFERNPYITFFLVHYNRLTGKKFYLPTVLNSELVKTVEIDDTYEAVLIDKIQSRGNIQYKYLAFIREKESIEPKHIISLELSAMTLEMTGKEAYFLCSFDKKGHNNFGIFEGEITHETFLKRVVELAKKWIDISSH